MRFQLAVHFLRFVVISSAFRAGAPAEVEEVSGAHAADDERLLARIERLQSEQEQLRDRFQSEQERQMRNFEEQQRQIHEDFTKHQLRIQTEIEKMRSALLLQDDVSVDEEPPRRSSNGGIRAAAGRLPGHAHDDHESGRKLVAIDPCGPNGQGYWIDEDYNGDFFIANIKTNEWPFRIHRSAVYSTLNIHGANVGVGTYWPDSKLHLKDKNKDTQLKIESSASFNPSLKLVKGENEFKLGIRDQGDFFVQAGDTAKPFKIRPGSKHDSIVISSSSNVGVGTPSPMSDLHIKARPNSNAELRLESPDPGTLPSILLVKGGTPTSPEVQWMLGVDQDRDFVVADPSGATRKIFKELDTSINELRNRVSALESPP